jgi:hypothetical protein
MSKEGVYDPVAGDATRYSLTKKADQASFIEPTMRRKLGNAQ